MSLSKSLKIDIDKIMKNMGKVDQKQILKEIKDAIYKGNPKERTITWRYSMVKRYLKTITKNQDFLNKVKPDDALTDRVVRLNLQKRDSEKRIVIDKEFINKIISFEKSKDIYEMYMYLLLISGRRLRELTEAKFTNVKSSNEVLICGIKKKGFSLGANVSAKAETFKPLVSKTKFFRVYRKFYRIYKNSNIKNISGNLQRIIKQKLGKDFKAHDLRKIYAIYSYKFKNKKNLKINSFIKDVLNHTSIDSSISYTGIVIKFNKDIIK